MSSTVKIFKALIMILLVLAIPVWLPMLIAGVCVYALFKYFRGGNLSEVKGALGNLWKALTEW